MGTTYTILWIRGVFMLTYNKVGRFRFVYVVTRWNAFTLAQWEVV